MSTITPRQVPLSIQIREIRRALMICKEAYDHTPKRFNNDRIRKHRADMYLRLSERLALAELLYREHLATLELLRDAGLLRGYDPTTEAIYL